VIPDRGVDAVVAHGCHKNHQRAEAIAEQGNLTIAFRETAYCVDSVLYVPYARISVIGIARAFACSGRGRFGTGNPDDPSFPARPEI